MADALPLKLLAPLPVHQAAAGYQISRRMSGVLDGSRWIAAGIVVLYHLRINVVAEQGASASHGAARWILWAAYRIGDCGPQAVLWFFVISGFLIGGKVVDDVRRQRFRPADYALARFSRLYVVLIPALLCGYGMDLTRVAWFGMNDAAGGETALSYGLSTFLANILCLQTILAPTLGSNLPLWSLACEAWYYVLFPLLVLATAPHRTRRQRVISALGATAVALLLLHNPKILAYFAVWLLGVAIWFCPAPVTRNRPLAWLIATISMAAYPAFTGPMKPLGILLVALSFANVLAAEFFVSPETEGRFWLNRWHAFLAGFSYSLYLTHAPLLHLVLTSAQDRSDPRLALPPNGWMPGAWLMGLLLLIYAYAWLFSRGTEAHTMQVRRGLQHLANRAGALRQ